MEKLKNILLVEDDASLRSAIESFLSKETNYIVKSVGDVTAAKLELENKDKEYDLILSDIKMPGGSGFDILEFIKNKGSDPVIIFMTGYGTIEQAVSAMKAGAYDFIVKPFQLTTLENSIRAALVDKANLISQSLRTEDVADFNKHGDKIFITNTPKIFSLIENLKKVATSKATVLIQGESGTGKEVLARMIHHYSPRRNKPFVAINCAALPDNLLESELFGHEKGSFTGAIQRQLGKFEISDGGTILLDEISEMSINMQTKLLRVLQECEIYRIGGNKPIPLNLRVIASTNRDLYKYMKEGNFREDLYYRINVIPIFVPPLRERGNDVVVLSNHFLDEFASVHERPRIEMDELARYKLTSYPWQGNVRELRNAMERAILVGNFDQIGNEDASAQNTSFIDSLADIDDDNDVEMEVTASAPTPASGEMTLSEIEKRVIFETLRRCGGNRTRTAEKLGISLRTLRNKLKAFKMGKEEVLEE
jgi:DNA-binding NtrC family response regulator